MAGIGIGISFSWLEGKYGLHLHPPLRMAPCWASIGIGVGIGIGIGIGIPGSKQGLVGGLISVGWEESMACARVLPSEWLHCATYHTGLRAILRAAHCTTHSTPYVSQSTLHTYCTAPELV